MGFKEDLEAKAEAQEIFNKSASHLLKQMARSTNKARFPSCQYRGVGNAMCALGIHIKDEFYTAALEGMSIRNNEVQEVLIKSGIDSIKHYKLLRNLQDVHDCYEPKVWNEKLLEVAQEHGLDPGAF